jgi:hypothetical protein
MEITCQTDIIQEALDLPQLHPLKALVHLLWEQVLQEMDLGKKIKTTMLRELLLLMDKRQHHLRHRMVRTPLKQQRIEIEISLQLRLLRVLLRMLIQMQIELLVTTSLAVH